MSLRIRLYGDPVLREKAQPITQFDAELKAFAQELIETVHEEEGFGVAAPQVGRSIRMFVAEMKSDHGYTFFYSHDGKKPPLELLFPLIIINPIFIEKSATTHTLSESCMSLPDIRVPVARPEYVKISFQDTEGNTHILEADGILAKCIQHEADHLDGILTIDYAPAPLLQRLKTKLVTIKRDQKAEEKDAKRSRRENS